ncbi:MAG: 50S ribosomal protein L22 [Patescibacteria group bacterium]
MEVKAKARHIHISSRKVRLVVDVIRGKRVKEAQVQLQFMKKAAALPVLKLLNSAIANATHNFQLDEQKLFVKTIAADEGPTLHRSMPRAHGRAAPIRKRSTHISIVLEEKEPKVKKAKTVAQTKS